MKRVLLIFALLLPLLAGAQHLKFMGIPLTGTISSFQTKLQAKGITYDAKASKSIDVGARVFNGQFFGKKADIYVYYNPKTKIVYRAKACLSSDSENVILKWYSELSDSLRKKYPNAPTADGIQDGYQVLFFDIINHADSDNTVVGTIDLFIGKFQLYDWDDPTYSLYVDYKDAINSQSNTDSNLDDL